MLFSKIVTYRACPLQNAFLQNVSNENTTLIIILFRVLPVQNTFFSKHAVQKYVPKNTLLLRNMPHTKPTF